MSDPKSQHPDASVPIIDAVGPTLARGAWTLASVQREPITGRSGSTHAERRSLDGGGSVATLDAQERYRVRDLLGEGGPARPAPRRDRARRWVTSVTRPGPPPVGVTAPRG
jgi:hypothetical protein